LADWLARGNHAVSVSSETEFIAGMKQQGLPVDMVAPPDAPGTVSSGNGQIALLNRAPHPNAAKVFVNWIASREGLALLGRARQKPTTRNDIDESYALPWEVPRPDLKYFDAYDWEFNAKRDKVRLWVTDLLKKG
jgi:iron(III) transport system substrate-binding protein